MVRVVRDERSGDISHIEALVTFKQDEKSIDEMLDHLNHGRLELSPPFQRDSVWTPAQRRKLIRSIYENMPIPCVFLSKRENDGKTVYDVIDGKQRLESIFMFLGAKAFGRKRFWFDAEWEEDGEYLRGRLFWSDLEPKEQAKLRDYPIQTITVDGPLGAVAEIFVRINSTGSRLTRQEIRKATFLKSSFLKACRREAERGALRRFFLENRVLSVGQLSRMKHIELVAELLLSIHHGAPINRKKAIDDAMRADTVQGLHLQKVIRDFRTALADLKRIFPELRTTRFRGVTDFYTLFLLVWKWRFVDRLVLSDKRRNRLAEQYLKGFGYNVDRVREKQRKLQKIEESERTFADYLVTVQGATDDISRRRSRQQSLEAIFQGCFDEKDPFRSFNTEQKRIIWFLSDQRCSERKCRKRLKWAAFDVDHVHPHSRGGQTKLENARILCPRCNRIKGAAETVGG